MNGTLNISAGEVPPLTPGDTINMLSSLNPTASTRSPDSERLMAIMNGISNAAEDDDLDQIDLLEDEDIDDDDEKVMSLTQPTVYERTPPKLDKQQSVKQRTQSAKVEQSSTASGSDETSKVANVSGEEEDTEAPKPNYKMYLIAGLILVAIVVVILVVKASSSKKQTAATSTPITQTETPVVTNEQKFYADTLDLADTKVYTDTMTIDKYIVLSQDSCQYIFEGYAENARAFVRTAVDLKTYNLYKKGARVQITYRHINLNSKEYYIEVEVLHE